MPPQASPPVTATPLIDFQNPVVAVFAFLVAVLLTAPVAMLFLARYRRAVLRSMMERAGAPVASPPVVPVPAVAPSAAVAAPAAAVMSSDPRYVIPGQEGWNDTGPITQPIGPLPLAMIAGEETAQPPLTGTAAALATRVRGAARHALLAYTAAGMVWAVFMGVAYLRVNHLELFPRRTAALVLIHLWPLVPALALAFPDRVRRPAFWIGPAAAVLLLAAITGAQFPAFLFQFWGVAMLLPTFALLPFAHRSLRAVGPVVLAALWLFVYGAIIIMESVMMFRVRALGTAPAFDPLWKPITLVMVILLGLLLWRALLGVARLYEHRMLSDQTLLVDAVFLIFTFWSAASQAVGSQHLVDAFWLGLAFVAYRVTGTLGLRPLWTAARRERPLRMLLLRVFGDTRRSERLYQELGASWRYAGSAQLIAGTDLAAAAIEPHEFLDFLVGRLSRRFVKGQSDLSARLSNLDTTPGPDGRYRVNEFFCHDDTWQNVLLHLVTESDLILMDLRTFSPRRQGCVFELHQLLNLVPVGRIVLLVDETTDQPFLRSVLEEAWAAMDPDSPNRRGAAGDAPLRLLSLPPHPTHRSADTLTALLCDAATR